MKRIYLDHNATTPVDPRVVEAMLPYFGEKFGNASSIHSFGREARKAIDDARQILADFVGAQPDEIFFTSGGTEADNFALKGIAFANKGKGNRVITSKIEHHAVLNTCKWLEKKGFEIIYLPVDGFGIVDIEELKKAINEKTILITVMHANNETGAIQPIAEIGKIAKEKGILFHTDAVQAVGKIPVNVNELRVDLLSVSAHKIYGPKGVGAIFIRKGTKIEKMLHGGHHENNKRAGTENVASIVGFAKAVEIAKKEMEDENKKLLKLRDKLEKEIEEKIKHTKINGHPEKRLPNTSNISFEFVEGESIILSLDLKGVAVSSGSACTSGSLEPSHVLSAMGVPPEIAQGSIRFSMGKDNTEEDIDFVVRELVGIVKHLREMSPLYKE
ncbi:MAG: cysteine desulfurase NifS [Elusimicrobia bacterium]|nr:cysteine desulfurase NifS [Elusimicrobiota bacterium]